ncbi:MAG: DUF1501 domain-containing protein [Flavobacteriales bacterium]|nr:DUF1501 domain-containing protein [Flavobacteriales bacterium]
MNQYPKNKAPLFNMPHKHEVSKDAHAQEHAAWDRRSFFKALGMGIGGSMMLGGMRVGATALSPLTKALAAADSDRVLVFIRLKGGNDGLNTIIPIYDYSTYANLRSTIRINQSDAFNLSAEFAMPNYMNSLESFWNDGKMKVVHGVGYEDQSLSHFRSSDIWATGTDESEVLTSGFLGRYYEEEYPDYLNNPPSNPLAIQIGSVGNLMFRGSDATDYAFSVTDPNQLYQLAQNGWLHDVNNLPECLYGEQLGFLRAITNSTYTYAGVINDAYEASSNSVSYPNSPLSNQLALIARLIKGGLGTKVYLVTLDGFDTHAEQPDAHQTLLTDLALGVTTFFQDLAASGRDNDVLAMTISEFGRRPEQNASDGTDHGAAAPSMFFGPALEGNGFIGNHPSLSNLDFAGNLIFDIDYRQLYASVLEHWLCIPESDVDEALLNVHYDRLELGFECVTGIEENDRLGLKHQALYMPDGSVTIEYSLPANMDVSVELFNIMGQQVELLESGYRSQGMHRVPVKGSTGQLANGQYIYRIVANGKPYSRSIVITR